MQVVMGELNGVYLRSLLEQALAKSAYAQAAVAYAKGSHEFFESYKQSNARLEFYGLLDASFAVALPVLDMFLKDYTGRMQCRLVNGHFHAKVIWWHGYGAYIGSANLTNAAWNMNVECGLFISDDELTVYGVADQLESLFSYLRQISLPLSKETYKNLLELQTSRQAVHVAENEATQKFKKHFGTQLPNKGFTIILSKDQKISHAQLNFVKEWHETLQLLRRLATKFQLMGRRPIWVSPDAPPAVHFDQLLHAYYYGYVRGSDDEGKSVEKVEKAYERNKDRLDAAFEEAISWWESLESAPFGEDKFIAVTTTKMRDLLSHEALRKMDLTSFSDAMRGVHSFRTHARQVQNKTFGLPPEYTEDLESRTNRLAKWLWEQRTEGGKNVRDVLEFVLYSEQPSGMEERLWMATQNATWRLPHFRKSILGETVGWALPNDFPPRNNRTNKALRSLGYDVELFSAG